MWSTSLSLVLALAALGRYEASEPHMGTLVTITLYAHDGGQADAAFRSAFDRIAELDRALSDYDPASELSRACQSNAPLSPDLRTVLDHAQRLAHRTGGAFDITAGPLTEAFREARARRELPSAEVIADARRRSGYRKLELTGNRLRCLEAGMRLDAGGIAKGFAADEALGRLRSLRITRALVAVSGDIVAGDPPPGRAAWRVRVQRTIVPLANAAVSTSGDQYQFLAIGGVRYSHVLDPRTGVPLRNSVPVSVVARTGIEADSLSTAIAVLGRGWRRYIPPGRVLRVLAGW